MSDQHSPSTLPGHGQRLEVSANTHFARLWDPTSGKGYTWKDVEVMICLLGQFFEGEDQRRAAEAAYMDAVKQPGASPVMAFQQAVMASPFAQEKDTLHAHDGGLFRYLRETWYHVFSDRGDLSAAMLADIRNAKLSRNLQDIKKLMAADRKGNAGGLTMEALQTAAAVAKGAGADAEADSAADLSGSMEVEVGEEVDEEVKEEVKVDTVAKSVTEMRLGDLWVIIDPKDAETPQSG